MYDTAELTQQACFLEEEEEWGLKKKAFRQPKNSSYFYARTYDVTAGHSWGANEGVHRQTTSPQKTRYNSAWF